MSTLTSEIQTLFNTCLRPTKLAMFMSTSEESDFKCIFSSNRYYKENLDYPIYNLGPLLRILITKTQILAESSLEKLYLNTPNEICYIHEWTDLSKKVFIFNFENIEHFNNNMFDQLILESKDKLEQIFHTAYYQNLRDKK